MERDSNLRDRQNPRGPGVEEDEIPIQWRADGRALYVYPPDRLPVEIFEVNAFYRHLDELCLFEDSTEGSGWRRAAVALIVSPVRPTDR